MVLVMGLFWEEFLAKSAISQDNGREAMVERGVIREKLQGEKHNRCLVLSDCSEGELPYSTTIIKAGKEQELYFLAECRKED
jgi:hypothetical protein